MIREIIHDPFILGIKAAAATSKDRNIGEDLLDTLKAHSIECVGMAANMIGVSKAIIAVNDRGKYILMYNPVIVSKNVPYEAQETCLSLIGPPKKTVRYKIITVSYLDDDFKQKKRSFSDFTAQIIQHEIDHLHGILI